MKAIDKDINFAGENTDTYEENSLLLSSNINRKKLILMNLLIIIFILEEFISSHILKERLIKENSEAKLIMVKSIR